MFAKILIANRGEIALRIIRTCKEMGIKTVAIYATVDKNSRHVQLADEAICVGPASSTESYLNIARIMAAASLTKADAIHPGYGFLSESVELAISCQENGFKFIGPSIATMRQLGDKVATRQFAKAIAIPIVPGSDAVVSSVESGLALAHRLGYPVVLKAVYGGGGKGIGIVRNDEDFLSVWRRVKREAQAAYGCGDLYLEQYLSAMKHVEIQIVRDTEDHIYCLTERECSAQRSHQKVLEETPAPLLLPALRSQLVAAATKAMTMLAYEGVGTVEFLVDTQQRYYLIEINPRIQVEHPITEVIANIDLIKAQICIAAGEQPLQDFFSMPAGHVIVCRINAQDPQHHFSPSVGEIQQIHLPGGPGIRIDTHIYAGYTISAQYDAMLAKLVVHAATRLEAIAKMKRALGEFVIEGVKTTIPFHLMLMDDPQFKAGTLTTDYLDTVGVVMSK